MDESGRATVLVVEDEAPLVEIYARWLDGDYGVRTAQNGEAALERIDEAVDVVLLDRLMPGMSGDEVLDAIDDMGLTPRVAMVTAVEPDFDIISMGFDDYLTKPIDREDLIETVERLLSRNSFADLEREYYALVEKQAALQSAKAAEELERSEEFTDLRERIETLRRELDAVMPDLDNDDFVAMVRDIEADSATEIDAESESAGRDEDEGGIERS
ncbi:HalX domain-containing protein [Salinirubellus sp. GCM10025818]|uniref:HalX domain-containing protein n=1 Tax=Salinirubellus TaxID=2162630 RepID=UPI0030D59881